MGLKAPQPTLEEFADLCLNYLVQNPEQLADFMNIAGLSADRLRASVGSRSFALGLLDHVVRNEELLLAVSRHGSLKPETIMQVWARHNPAG